jgi:hypothetical protein
MGKEDGQMKRIKPPNFAEKLLRILAASRSTGILGNTEEEYRMSFSEKGRFRADIACINIMNLTTAYSSKRAREIGMRKVIGTQRGDIVKQFLGEGSACGRWKERSSAWSKTSISSLFIRK